MAKYAILSDIHGNLQALQQVHCDLQQFDICGIILLGDLIDYGMQSNEVVEYVRTKMSDHIICNIWGNHERAILLSDFTGFSSQRGVDSAKYTAFKLETEIKKYLETELDCRGFCEFTLDGKKCLAVHGSMENPFWKSIFPDSVHGDYKSYDLVFSGHSHCSHMFTKFYKADCPELRDQHAVMFMNPGSVGQPRNQHPEAQDIILDSKSMSVDFRGVSYDIDKTISYFNQSVDEFYWKRLKNGV